MIKLLAYHGSQHKKFNFNENKVLYLTTNKEKATSYAKREWDEGLIEGEIPVVYTFEVSIEKPYRTKGTEKEFFDFCDSVMNEYGKEDLIEKGYDSIIHNDLIGVFYPNQVEFKELQILPKSHEYYYTNEDGIDPNDVDDYYYDGDELNESVEDNFNSKNNCKVILKEAYIKGDKGNIYYTKNSDMFLSIIKNTFISKNIPVRVYYDTIKQMYVFGNAFDYIHADLATNMKYYSKVYGVDEMRANISYLKQNCALFQVLPDDDLKKYDMGDGYTHGWFLKLDDLIFACRSKEYEKVRDNVPLFKDHIGEWMDVQFYLSKKNNINESVEDKILYIIRGVPGSGKSTLAHKLTDNVVEADQYFYDDKGNYNWSADKLNQAHNWCYNTVKKYMEEGRDKIAVANTFVKKRDYKRYVELAEQFGYKVDIRVCNGNFKNIHGVPDETVEKMRAKFQLDESIKYINGNKSKTRFTSSVYEMKNYIEKHKNLRIVYDRINNWYFFNDSDTSVHTQILDDAISAGYYEDVKSGNDLLYSPRFEEFALLIVDEVLNIVDAESDSYNFAYVYNNFNIYDRYGEFQKIPLYNVLGKPNKIIDIYDELFDEDGEFKNLNESIIYVSKKDLSDIILKNPARKELKEYKINNWRILQDIQGNYYFADAMKYIHQQMSNKLNSKGIEAVDAETDNAGIISYNILTNTFYYRLLGLLDEKDIKKEYNNSYLSKEFPNAELKRSNDDVEELNESTINDKVFYTKQLSRMLNICLNIGNARFIYIPEANLYVIGDAHNNTHISLFISALNEGKFNIGENDVDEYFDEYINSAEDTGAIITKKYANDENVWLKCPDTTNVINDYGKFYLCNGLCIEESLAKLTNTEPRFIKEKSYLEESIKSVNKNFADTKLITTPYELNNYLKNNRESRVVYDIKNNWYLVGNAETSIHINLINDAFVDGYYQPFEYNGKMINPDNELDAKGGKLIYELNPTNFILFRTSSDQLNGEEYYYDGYKYCYVYDDYYVFIRDNNFEKTSLYQMVLGFPKDIEFIGDIDEDEGLNESIVYASKKDLSDIILKNPTRKELKENGLEFCRYMFEDDNTYYFADAKEYSHLDISQLFLDIFKKYNLHTDGGYYSVKENCFYIRNDFGCEKNKERLDNTKLLHKLFGNFKSIIYEGAYPKKYEYYDKRINESAENDKTLRDYAVKLANICLDALVKTKYETKISGTQVQINVDKAFKKAVPMLKKSPYEYFIILVDKNIESYPSYGKTIDRKYGLITLPVFTKDPVDQIFGILSKHKTVLKRLYSKYKDKELSLKIGEYAIKYLKKEIEKNLSNVRNQYQDILTHECTHLLDDIRRTSTYKSKEQKHDTSEDNEKYYNSPEEQNAYYQETVSVFDNWAKDVGYKTFDIFFDDFIKQYKGEWNMLNEKNKRKLKKRAYAYWELYIKE